MALPAGRPRPDRVFERLYRRHIDEVYRYALAVLGNRADAEDVTQTAFLNAYRAFQSGQQPERPLNWLIAITHNVCRQRFREAARKPREVEFDHELAAEFDQDDGRDLGHEDISRALSQLSFSQRSALALRELEGRSYREIAQILEITEAAVETLIFRARRAFREQLEGSLSCSEAERAISRQLDGMLSRSEKAGLRAHLRACQECASLARRLRAQRSALRGIAFLPLPQSLVSFSGAGGSVAGGAALGTGLVVKVAVFGAATLVAAGVGTKVVTGSSSSATPKAEAAPPRAQLVSSASSVRRLIATRAEVSALVSSPEHARTSMQKPVRKSGASASRTRPVHAKHVRSTSNEPSGKGLSWSASSHVKLEPATVNASHAEHPASGGTGRALGHEAPAHGNGNAAGHQATPKKPAKAARGTIPASGVVHPVKKDKQNEGRAPQPIPAPQEAVTPLGVVPATAGEPPPGSPSETQGGGPPEAHPANQAQNAAAAPSAKSNGNAGGKQKP
jgi:RNA polymerase sigma factor (sigma-70 family)